MSRVLYIILVFVALCRIVDIAAPLVQQSVDLCVLHDSECSNDDSVSDKGKYECKEENCITYTIDTDEGNLIEKRHALFDNRLLQHTAEPSCPPPNVA